MLRVCSEKEFDPFLDFAYELAMGICQPFSVWIRRTESMIRSCLWNCLAAHCLMRGKKETG